MNFEEINKEIYDKHSVTVLTEQTFWIGENANIEVIVNLYKYNDKYNLVALLKKIVVIDAIEYTGSINNSIEVLTAMEKLVNDNEEYILDLVSTNGE